MGTEDNVKNIYDSLESHLDSEIYSNLNQSKPDRSPKGGNRIMKGALYGSPKGKIWDGSKCFYEIGLGKYIAASGSTGGIGFVSYYNQKVCGSGIHERTVNNIMLGFTDKHPDYNVAFPNDCAIAVFKYYINQRIPDLKEKAPIDLAKMIQETFSQIDALTI